MTRYISLLVGSSVMLAFLSSLSISTKLASASEVDANVYTLVSVFSHDPYVSCSSALLSLASTWGLDERGKEGTHTRGVVVAHYEPDDIAVRDDYPSALHRPRQDT